MIEEDCSAV